MGLLLGAGERAPAGDDLAVVAHADPAAPGVIAVRVEGEIQRALGTHGMVDGAVPADQCLVVPKAQLALPAVAAVGHRDRAVGEQLEDLAALVDLQRVGVDARLAVFPGLPAGPPVARQVELVADLAGELGEGDAERIGQRDGGSQMFRDVRLTALRADASSAGIACISHSVLASSRGTYAAPRWQLRCPGVWLICQANLTTR